MRRFCALKAEKVVNPPQKPVMRKFLSESVPAVSSVVCRKAIRKPINIDPIILTHKVANGKRDEEWVHSPTA